MENITSLVNQRDKESVLEGLIDEYEKSIVNLAYTYVKNWSTAEDISQEVFIKIYRKMDTFNGRSSVKTWIYRITVNHCKDYLRKKYIKSSLLTNVFSGLFHKSINNDVEQLYINSVDSTELVKSVLQLPIKYREMIILFYYEDFSVEEISNLLSINRSTIRTRLQRGRDLLRFIHKEGERNGD